LADFSFQLSAFSFYLVISAFLTALPVPNASQPSTLNHQLPSVSNPLSCGPFLLSAFKISVLPV
jgi:hypothetical protein